MDVYAYMSCKFDSVLHYLVIKYRRRALPICSTWVVNRLGKRTRLHFKGDSVSRCANFQFRGFYIREL